MGNDRLPSVRARTISVHFRTIQGATTNIDRDIEAANLTFNQYDINLLSLSQETIDAPELLDLGQPTCVTGQDPTDEENQLFNLGRDRAPTDIIVYYLRSTSSGALGCAAFPDDRPGCVITDGATRWTLAHELGHILGLQHLSMVNNLMARSVAPTNAGPPRLTPDQLNTIRASRFLV